MKEKKKLTLLLGVLLVAVVITVGVSYALWQITLKQESTNIITTGCFKIEFTDKDNITLSNAYPMSDAEGKALTPYEFTITNTCESRSGYVINLETISSGDKILEDKYVKASLKKGEKEVFFHPLDVKYLNEEKGIEESTSAYKLYKGKLEDNESITFTLNLWMDENTPALDSVMNAVYESKIVVLNSYIPPINTKNMMVPMNADVNYGTAATIVKNYTYTQNGKYRVSKVIFQDEMSLVEGAVEVVDFSVDEDNSVLGYYVKNESEDMYTLYIQANGKIKVNPIASYYGSGVYSIVGIENLDTSNVTDMSNMFCSYEGTSLDLSTFDTSNVTNMSEMFAEGRNLTDLVLSKNFDTSSVTDMSGMFYDTYDLTYFDISHFDTSNVTDMSNMFYMYYDETSLATSLDLSNFDTSSVTNMSYMFCGMYSITDLDISNFDTSNVTNMSYMFYGMGSLTTLDVSHFDTSSVTDMGVMFYGMSSLTSLNLGSNFNTSSVKNMSSMFNGLSSLISLDLSSFDTSNVTSMYRMFDNCSNLTHLDVSHFDTSNVTSMNHMFSKMSGLTSLDLSHFITSKVTDMNGMFYHMSSLTSLDLSSFDTSNVTTMGKSSTNITSDGMFSGCTSLTTLDLSSFDTSKVTTMSSMFYDCSNLHTIIYGDNFIRTSQLTFTYMFKNCPANKPTHESWDGAFE